MEACLQTWCLNKDLNIIRSLPIIVLWFIWKARNQSCFEDFLSLPFQVSSLCLGLLRSIPHGNIVIKTRLVVAESIDKTFPWGYFDGLALGNPKLCGAGGIIYFSEGHYISFKAGLGNGINNHAELLGIKLLLKLTLENHNQNTSFW